MTPTQPHDQQLAPTDGGAVRLRDVASAAGVSLSTASKALNDVGQLREETRRKVKEVAEGLGFVPDSRGRGLKSGRTYTVGMLTTDSFGRFSIPVMTGAEDVLSAGEMAIIMCDTRDDPLREQHYLRSLRARRVDGLIVTGRSTDARPSVGSGTPTVYAFTPSLDPADHCVVTDEGRGARLAIEHLQSIGRRRIVHVTGPERHHSARARADAVASELVAPPMFGQWSEEWGRRAVDMLLAAHADVDAVACGSDQIARGVCDRLRELGVDVPGRVAVTGFDNWDVMAEASRPPLTTVDANLRELGTVAGQMLLALIRGEDVPLRRVVEPRLEIRASTV